MATRYKTDMVACSNHEPMKGMIELDYKSLCIVCQGNASRKYKSQNTVLLFVVKRELCLLLIAMMHSYQVDNVWITGSSK